MEKKRNRETEHTEKGGAEEKEKGKQGERGIQIKEERDRTQVERDTKNR